MRAGVRVFLAMVLAVVLVAGPHREPPPRAEATPAALVLPAVCVVTVVAAGVCAAISAALVWWVYSHGPSTAAALQQVVDGVVAWYEGNPASVSRQNLDAQFSAHPTYVDPDGAMLGEWWGQFNSFNSAGWSQQLIANRSTAVWRNAAFVSGGTTMYTTAASNLAWSGAVNTWSCGGTMGTTMADIVLEYVTRASYAGGNGTAATKSTMTYKIVNQASGAVLKTASIVVQQGGAADSIAVRTDSIPCSQAPQPLQISMLWQATDSASYPGGGLVAVTMWNGLSGNAVAQTYTYPSFVATQVVQPAQPTLGAGRTHVVADPNSLVGWDGVSALPLADGTTAAPVTARPVAGAGAAGAGYTGLTETDKTWWEGVFAPVTGALSAIQSAAVATTTAVTALPTTIANVFNPAVAVADFQQVKWPGMVSAGTAVLPGCLVGPFAEFPALFTGDGAAVEVLFVYGTRLTFPIVQEVVAVTRPLSAVAVMVLLWMWAIHRGRRVTGGE